MEPLTLLPALNLSLAPHWQLWSQLRDQVGGRLYESVPFAQPCYDDFNSSACVGVRHSYLDEG